MKLDLLFSDYQVWVLLIGTIVPLGGYILNKYLPIIEEPAKAAVQVLLAVVAGALYTALDTNVLGFNDATLQLVLTAVVGTLLSHKLLWKPAKVNVLLGSEKEGKEVTPVV